MKIFLAGATGFIGSRLRDVCLALGHTLIVLSRFSKKGLSWEGRPGELFVFWDGRTLGTWCRFLEGVDAVVNLAGENIAAERWTEARKCKIVSSRVGTTRLLVEAIEKSPDKPAVLLNASAAGYYGDVPSGRVTEQHERGKGFLAETCCHWEEEALRAEKWGVRVALARLGPVLGEGGGILRKMLPPFLFFMGGPLGSGKQWIPWIHREDAVRALLFIVEEKSLSGPINMTAPEPVSMKNFSATIGKILGRPSWFPVPSFALRVLMGEMASVVLDGACAVPEKLLRAGFLFHFPSLVSALENTILKTRKGISGNRTVPHV